MTETRRVFVALASALALAAVGCDESPGTGVDAGPDPMVDGGPVEDGGPLPDGGGDTDAGPDVDGGPLPSDCAAEAEAYCTLYEECSPEFFVAAYENQTICRRVQSEACDSPVEIPSSNGPTDEAACEAATAGDCEAFFSAAAPPIPAACVLLPGDVEQGDPCFVSAQCGMGMNVSGDPRRMFCSPIMRGTAYEFGTAECPEGTCTIVLAEDATCMPNLIAIPRQACDTYAGQQCLLEFDPDAADGTPAIVSATDNRCRAVQYGTGGQPCYPGTQRECASGFKCISGSRTCMPVRSEGEDCSPDTDLCDSRLGLTCQSIGGADICAGPVFAEVGEQCGENVPIGGGRMVTRNCSAYALPCDTSVTPSVCVARVPLAATCTQSPDNCEPGLECDDATDRCVVPDPDTTCP